MVFDIFKCQLIVGKFIHWQTNKQKELQPFLFFINYKICCWRFRMMEPEPDPWYIMHMHDAPLSGDRSGLVWNESGSSLGSIWDHFGIHLRSFWGHCGISSWSKYISPILLFLYRTRPALRPHMCSAQINKRLYNTEDEQTNAVFI